MHAYDHVNLGLQPTKLQRMLEGAGFRVENCRISSRESRPPYFESSPRWPASLRCRGSTPRNG
ncbi:hypothetical protein [Oleomonas cavernae]|uniref:hypothetical protein n=1 Tax=Oleomonas cavernae TaxID=2320859 RepID=UPI0018F568E5|nr:hypothetical protein [Oleomonas cavernae]